MSEKVESSGRNLKALRLARRAGAGSLVALAIAIPGTANASNRRTSASGGAPLPAETVSGGANANVASGRDVQLANPASLLRQAERNLETDYKDHKLPVDEGNLELVGSDLGIAHPAEAMVGRKGVFFTLLPKDAGKGVTFTPVPAGYRPIGPDVTKPTYVVHYYDHFVPRVDGHLLTGVPIGVEAELSALSTVHDL